MNTNALRPYLGFGSITLYETTGKSKYNSLQAQVERRGTRGVGFTERLARAAVGEPVAGGIAEPHGLREEVTAR